MTIEITLLPISCRTLHKIKKFLCNLSANLFVWSILIFGSLMLFIPRDVTLWLNNRRIMPLTEMDVLSERIGGGLIIVGAIVLMAIIYGIKISWCKKEKSK